MCPMRPSRLPGEQAALSRSRPGSSDRKRPYYAFVNGNTLTPNKHVLSADVRLKIPKYMQRRYPGRFKKTRYRRNLKFFFRACKNQ